MQSAWARPGPQCMLQAGCICEGLRSRRPTAEHAGRTVSSNSTNTGGPGGAPQAGTLEETCAEVVKAAWCSTSEKLDFRVHAVCSCVEGWWQMHCSRRRQWKRRTAERVYRSGWLVLARSFDCFCDLLLRNLELRKSKPQAESRISLRFAGRS